MRKRDGWAPSPRECGLKYLTWTQSVGPLEAASTPSSCKSLLLLLRLWACGQRVSIAQAQRHVVVLSNGPTMTKAQVEARRCSHVGRRRSRLAGINYLVKSRCQIDFARHHKPKTCKSEYLDRRPERPRIKQPRTGRLSMSTILPCLRVVGTRHCFTTPGSRRRSRRRAQRPAANLRRICARRPSTPSRAS